MSEGRPAAGGPAASGPTRASTGCAEESASKAAAFVSDKNRAIIIETAGELIKRADFSLGIVQPGDAGAPPLGPGDNAAPAGGRSSPQPGLAAAAAVKAASPIELVRVSRQAVVKQLGAFKSRRYTMCTFGGAGDMKSTTGDRILYPQVSQEENVLQRGSAYGHVTKVAIAVRKVATPCPPRVWDPLRAARERAAPGAPDMDLEIEHHEEGFYIKLVQARLDAARAQGKGAGELKALAARFCCAYPEAEAEAGSFRLTGIDEAAAATGRLRLTAEQLCEGCWAPLPGGSSPAALGSDIAALRRLGTMLDYCEVRGGGSKRVAGRLTVAQALMIKCVYVSSWSACIPLGWQLMDLMGYGAPSGDGGAREDFSEQVKLLLRGADVVIACTCNRVFDKYRAIALCEAAGWSTRIDIRPEHVPVIIVPVRRYGELDVKEYPDVVCKAESFGAFEDAITNRNNNGIHGMTPSHRKRLLEAVSGSLLCMFIDSPGDDDDDDGGGGGDDGPEARVLLPEFDTVLEGEGDPNRWLLYNMRILVLLKDYIYVVALTSDLFSAIKMAEGTTLSRGVLKILEKAKGKGMACANGSLAPDLKGPQGAMRTEIFELCAGLVEFGVENFELSEGERPDSLALPPIVARCMGMLISDLSFVLRSFFNDSCRACCSRMTAEMESTFGNIVGLISKHRNGNLASNLKTCQQFLVSKFDQITNEFILDCAAASDDGLFRLRAPAGSASAASSPVIIFDVKERCEPLRSHLYKVLVDVRGQIGGDQLSYSGRRSKSFAEELMEQLFSGKDPRQVDPKGRAMSLRSSSRTSTLILSVLAGLPEKLGDAQDNTLQYIANTRPDVVSTTSVFAQLPTSTTNLFENGAQLRRLKILGREAEPDTRITCASPFLAPLRPPPILGRRNWKPKSSRPPPLESRSSVSVVVPAGKTLYARMTVTVPLVLTEAVSIALDPRADKIFSTYRDSLQRKNKDGGQRFESALPFNKELPPVFVPISIFASSRVNTGARNNGDICLSIYQDLHDDTPRDAGPLALGGAASAVASEVARVVPCRETPLIFVLEEGKADMLERKLREAGIDPAHVVIMSVSETGEGPSELSDLLSALGSAPVVLEGAKVVAERFFGGSEFFNSYVIITGNICEVGLHL